MNSVLLRLQNVSVNWHNMLLTAVSTLYIQSLFTNLYQPQLAGGYDGFACWRAILGITRNLTTYEYCYVTHE